MHLLWIWLNFRTFSNRAAVLPYCQISLVLAPCWLRILAEQLMYWFVLEGFWGDLGCHWCIVYTCPQIISSTCQSTPHKTCVMKRKLRRFVSLNLIQYAMLLNVYVNNTTLNLCIWGSDTTSFTLCTSMADINICMRVPLSVWLPALWIQPCSASLSPLPHFASASVPWLAPPSPSPRHPFIPVGPGLAPTS